MIDHLTLTVRDYDRNKAFYGAALGPLGYAVQMEFGQMCGIGAPGKPAFWLKAGETPTSPMHLAFMARDRALVDAFYEAALAAGASDNGKPGLREQYHPDYYGAFVIGPEGHFLEAVCHLPPAAAKAKAKAPARPAARAARSARASPGAARRGARKVAAAKRTARPAKRKARRK